MDIKFCCPKCRQSLEAPPDMDGQQIPCPNCKNLVAVPRATASTPQPAAAPPAVTIQNTIAVPALQTSGLAAASLVMGILGVLVGWLCCGLVFPLLAIVFGHIAHSQINKQPNVLSGKGMAITGFILGYVSLVLSIVIGIAVGVFAAIMEAATKSF